MPVGSWLQSVRTRLIAGEGLRKTRFHTYLGDLVDAPGFVYLPHALATTLLVKVFAHHVELPWLGFRGVKALASVVEPSSRVLEFGSGMSSLFFARRCAELVSIECDTNWYGEMQKRFAASGVKNIDYRLRTLEEYAALDDCPDASFDIALVDGAERTPTMRTALAKVKPGGFIYLDNSDYFGKARRMLLAAAGGETGDVRIFRDFTPFQLVAGEGILARLPPPSS
jgi:SAM-dependent methyltransferase